VLKVLNTTDDKSSNSVPFSSRSVLTSLLSSLEVYPDKSSISLDVKDFATLISIEVSLDKSEISVKKGR